MTTRKALDQELRTINDDIIRLSSLVAQSIVKAVQAFDDLDEELAQTVINEDNEIDELHSDIENRVTQTFALQQPMAGDMRRLIADLLISNELERMGDYAEGIARVTLRYAADTDSIKFPNTLTDMSKQVAHMLNEVMSAYSERDAFRARATAKLDHELDSQYKDLFQKLISQMSKGKKITVEQGTYLLWVGHNLERIGDRVTNISERVIYAHSGDVRDLNPRK